MENKTNPNAKLFLRVGLAFVFLYAGIAAFFNPESWVGFIPGFLTKIIPENFVLYSHIAFNVILGLWLLSDKKIFYASILSALALFTITIFNLNSFDIVFRDVGLLLATAALVILSKE